MLNKKVSNLGTVLSIKKKNKILLKHSVAGLKEITRRVMKATQILKLQPIPDCTVR